MKSIRLFSVLAFSILLGSVAFANDQSLAAAKELRKEVSKLVQDPELAKYGIEEAEVSVHFTIDEDNRLVVLNVASDIPYLEEFIKQRLDLKKISVAGLEAFVRYNVKISFESEKLKSS
jgi:hypothetical protein